MSLMLFSYLNVFAPGNVLISMSVQFWPGLHIEPFPSLEIFHLAVHSSFSFCGGWCLQFQENSHDFCSLSWSIDFEHDHKIS